MIQTAWEFDIRPATRADEPDLRALVSSVVMPGDVAVRFAREPDYFLGTSIMGDPCDVLIARTPDGTLAGMACRAERRVFVNGVERTVGYLGQIRIAAPFRGHGLVRLGAQMVEQATPPGLPYLGVIARENPRAREALVGAGLPKGLRAVRISGLTSCSIVLHRGFNPPVRGVEVSPVHSLAEMDEVVAYLDEVGRRRQFFPAHTLADVTGGRALRGLQFADVLVARRDRSITGVMATWDQSAYKQDIVAGYSRVLRWLRPGYDVLARLAGAAPLTRPGQAIPLAFGALTCVSRDDPDVARALIHACTARARAQGKAFLMIGLADADPLLRVVRRWPHLTYRSDLYLLSWGDAPVALDGRLPYIEIATL